MYIRALLFLSVLVASLAASQVEQTQEKRDIAATSTHSISLRKFGDVAQFLPAASFAYAIFLRDFVGARQQAVGFLAVVASTYAIKYALHYSAPLSPKIQSLSKRPDGENFEGFPSGHTASAFAAVGFLQKRYGLRLGLPAAVIASVVGISRIHAQRHTITQVICGGMLGFFLSFILASRRDDKRIGGARGLWKGGKSANHAPSTKDTLYQFALLSLMVF
ncbi:phosphatase PAP2 family protein [Helicobacter canis]|uniref:phosphatase PAP2 family protein n=1 Tax=Helicobacter canis TaxID=29419 RepID=UPI002943DE1D|nr:phosphatase PAP2 family protein [Helicobacter canis]